MVSPPAPNNSLIGGVHNQRNKDVLVGFWKRKRRRQHPNHGAGPPIDVEGAADDVAVTPEFGVPQALGDEDHTVTARPRLVIQERPS